MVQEGVGRVMPQAIERSTHVLCASLSFAPAVLAVAPVGRDGLVGGQPDGSAALWALFGYGCAMVLVATFLIDHFDLFGLRQVWLQLIGTPDSA